MMADLGGPSATYYRNRVAERPRRASAVVLPHHTRAAAIARRSTGEVLYSWDLDGLKPVAVLVVSELVTNAVLHARPGASSPELHLHAVSTWLRIEVHDTDPRPPQPRTPNGLDEAGRGLLLIEAITDQWGRVRHRNRQGRLGNPAAHQIREATLPDERNYLSPFARTSGPRSPRGEVGVTRTYLVHLPKAEARHLAGIGSARPARYPLKLTPSMPSAIGYTVALGIQIGQAGRIDDSSSQRLIKTR